jgi:deoxyribonuclease-4
MKFGCHVSIAGGVQNAPANAAALGCEVFQMFTRSPRGGGAPALGPEVLEKFFNEVKKYGFTEYVVHTPYYINFGSKEKRIAQSSTRIVREELERASVLKSSFVMTHLGSFRDLGREKGMSQLISGLAKTLSGYKGSTGLLLEISAGAGETIGGTFEQLAEILVHPKLQQHHLDVCFDTCHAFASGYDLRDAAAVKKTLAEFDRHIGLERLKVIHANDSKGDLGDHKDRHEHIGRGKIGAAGFVSLVGDPRLKNINMYLETEPEHIKDDLAILKKMRGLPPVRP